MKLDYATPSSRTWSKSALWSAALSAISPLALVAFMWESNLVAATVGIFLPPLAAVVCGVRAILQTRKSAGALRGVVFAIAGTFSAAGWILILIWVYFIDHNWR